MKPIYNGENIHHFTPGKVIIKRTEKPLTCATALAVIMIGLVAGIAAGWFLYGIVGLGR